MRRHQAILILGLGFSVLSLVGYRVFGQAADGLALTVAAVFYVFFTVSSRPKISLVFFLIQYLVLAVSLIGIVSFLFEYVGPAKGALSVLVGDFLPTWSHVYAYEKAAVYLGTRLAVIFILVIAASINAQRRRPILEDLVVGMFAGSVVNIPCDFALRDALSGIGTVQFDGSFYAFAFAAGLGSIEFAILLHILVAVATGVFLWLRRKHQSMSNEMIRPASRLGE